MSDVGDMRARLKLVCVVFAGIAAGCASTPSPPARPSAIQAMTSVDTSWQRIAFERRHGGCLEDGAAAALARIVQRLTGQDWEGPVVQTQILSSPNPNAYVLASGYMYVTVGLLDLACTDDELAAVVAHELAHLQDARGFASSGFSMSDRLGVEMDADLRAAWRLIETRYEPAALVDMIARLADEQPEGWANSRRQQLEAFLGTSFVVGVVESPDASANDL